jgi:rubrerythrin
MSPIAVLSRCPAWPSFRCGTGKTLPANTQWTQQPQEGYAAMLDEKLLEYIDIAISREEEAFRFYTDLAGRVTDGAAREALTWIGEEEKKHKAYLEKFRADGVGPEAMRLSDVVYYKIAEHLDEPEVEEDMSRADIFLVASHREFRAYKFYSELAMLYDAGDAVHDMLHKIANEELKHKEKMEYLYANTAFPQTDGG